MVRAAQTAPEIRRRAGSRGAETAREGARLSGADSAAGLVMRRRLNIWNHEDQQSCPPSGRIRDFGSGCTHGQLSTPSLTEARAGRGRADAVRVETGQGAATDRVDRVRPAELIVTEMPA